MSTGDTGIRSITARVIAEHQGAVLLRRKNHGYEFTGLYERTSAFCKTWPEAERVLIRMKVPSDKIKAIFHMFENGKDVVIRRDVPQPEVSESGIRKRAFGTPSSTSRH